MQSYPVTLLYMFSGLLHIGDEILEVAGKSVRDKTPDEVVQMLVSSYKQVLYSGPI